MNNPITKETTIGELMDDRLCGKNRNIYDKNGIVIGTVQVKLADELWIETQKQMMNDPFPSISEGRRS